MQSNNRLIEKSINSHFLLAPLLWVAAIIVLLLVWAFTEPETAVRFFDQAGYSPFELATIPVFAAIIPLAWWKCPFAGSKRRKLTLLMMLTVVVIMAIVKELDWHRDILHWCYPDFIGEDGGVLDGKLFKPNGDEIGGTPFKSRVLFNSGAPLGMRALIFAYFALFFGVFAAGFVYLLPSFVKGVFRLEDSAWAAGCFGASGVLVQISDRLPAWTNHLKAFNLSGENEIAATKALCTVIEEGGEMMIALFALLTIYLSSKRLKG